MKRWIFSLVIAFGLNRSAHAEVTLPEPEEIWNLIREISATYAAVDTVDYEMLLRSPEIETQILRRTGGIPIVPEIRMIRRNFRTSVVISVPQLPEPFRGKAEERMNKELDGIAAMGVMRNFGWNIFGAFMQMLDANNAYDLIEWTPERAVIEFNDLSEPYRGKVLRSIRFYIDRKRGILTRFDQWLGPGAVVIAEFEHSDEGHFPGTRTPLVNSFRLTQQGFYGPPVLSIAVIDGKYTPTTSSPEMAELAAWKTKAQQAGLSRWMVEKIQREPDGGLRIDLTGADKVNLAKFADWPIRELNLTRVPISDLAPLASLPIESLILDDTRVTNLLPLAGMPLRSLSMRNVKVTDFAPLSGKQLHTLIASGLPTLKNLDVFAGMPLQLLEIGGSEVSDLQPLAGMPLQELVISSTKVRDLTPLLGLPLQKLDAELAPIASLAPLAECRDLAILRLTAVPATDLAALASLKLMTLWIGQTKISDLSPLRGMPLVELVCNGAPIADITPILDLPNLERLVIPRSARGVANLRQLLKLSRLSFRSDGSRPAQTADEFWKEFDPQKAAEREAMVARLLETVKAVGGNAIEKEDGSFHVQLDNTPVEDITHLKGFPISGLFLRNTRVKNIAPVAAMPLKELALAGLKELPDLSPLSDLALEKLWLENTALKDLTPLRGLQLRELFINDTAVSDLSPLADMRLVRLNASGIKATDLTPLRRVPLKMLHLHRNPQITDVSPLAEMKTLEHVLLPSAIADASSLRALPNLKTIDTQYRGPGVTTPAATFFATYDPHKLAADRKAAESKRAELEARLRAAGFNVQPKLLGDGTIELSLDDQKIADLQLLAGYPISRLSLRKAPVADLSPLRGMPLKFLSIRETQVSDLSPLAELPLEELVADVIPAVDFTPIAGLRLRRLSIGGTKVQNLAQFAAMPLVDLTIWHCPNIHDIAPLRSLALIYLNMASTPISDLSPLRGLPLRKVRLHGTMSLDVSVLADCPQLESLTLPMGATGIEALRRLPNLRELALTKTEPPRMPLAAEFWRTYEASTKPSK